MAALFSAVLLLLLRLTAPVRGAACQDLAASDHYVTTANRKWAANEQTSEHDVTNIANELLTSSYWPVCCNYEWVVVLNLLREGIEALAMSTLGFYRTFSHYYSVIICTVGALSRDPSHPSHPPHLQTLSSYSTSEEVRWTSSQRSDDVLAIRDGRGGARTKNSGAGWS